MSNKRFKGSKRFGSGYVSKHRKRLAKDVMKHDAEFLRQNTYQEKGLFGITRTKKVGTRRERQQIAANMVSDAFKDATITGGKKGGKTTRMEEMLTLGMSKKQKSQMDAATATLSDTDNRKSILNRYYGREDKYSANAMEQNALNSVYAQMDKKPTNNTTTSVTPTQPTKKNKKSTSSKSRSSQGATVSLGNLGTSVTYYKRGGKMKRGGSFNQYD